MISEIKITKLILEASVKNLLDNLSVDAAIAGAGPSGLVAAKYLSEAGIKVALFERKLSTGGGMWGGGMMFPRIVVQKRAKHILDDFKINSCEIEKNYFVADSIESVTKLTAGAIDAGANIFKNLRSCDKLEFCGNRETSC